MRRLEESSGGLWRPSPGSVYPHLQMLEDEGLVRSSEVDGSRTFTLTEAGAALLPLANKAVTATQDFDPSGLFAAIIIIVAMVVIGYAIIGFFERRALAWQK